MSDQDEIEYVREVCEAATPGPWRRERGAQESRFSRSPENLVLSVCDGSGMPVGDHWISGDVSLTDARAIALLGSTWREREAVIEAADARDIYRPRCIRPILGKELAGPVYRGAVPREEKRCGDCVACRLRDALDAYRAAVRAHRERSEE